MVSERPLCDKTFTCKKLRVLSRWAVFGSRLASQGGSFRYPPLNTSNVPSPPRCTTQIEFPIYHTCVKKKCPVAIQLSAIPKVSRTAQTIFSSAAAFHH